MNIKALLFVAIIIISSNATSQGEFEIKVTVNKAYVGNYLDFHTYSSFSGFEYPNRVSDTVFFIKGKCKEKYEYATFRLQQSDVLSYLCLFISADKMELKLNHLCSKDSVLDIQLKDFPFQEEQERYLSMTYQRQGYNNILKFISKYPKSYISYFSFIETILKANIVEPDSLESIFCSLDEKYKNSKKGNRADSIIQQKAFASKFSIGNIFPNFIFKTISNNTYRLSDFANKGYVLVCYWASWCGPCRKNIPRLKKINDIYASKGLQIISISIDDNEKNWKDALEKEQMPWTQICDIEKYVQDSKLRKRLYMTFVPQYYLLNKNGTIIYNNFILKDDENYSILFETLNKSLQVLKD